MAKTQNKIKKTRSRSGPVKKWSDDECISMLHYILDKKNDGKPFEKPTAQIFYEKMLDRLKVEDVNWKQSKAKMNNFRVRYVEVKKWLDQTGQGVDSGTIEGYKASKCPFFDLLDCIYGDKASITIPYIYESPNAIEPSNQETKSNDVSHSDAQENNDELIQNELSTMDNGFLMEYELPDVFDTFEIPTNPIDVEPAISIVSTVMDLDSPDTHSTIDLDNYFELPITNKGTEQENLDSDSVAIGSESSSSHDHSKQTVPAKSRPLAKYAGAVTQAEIDDINFNRFAADPRGSTSDEENDYSTDSRIARYKKQLSERPSGRQYNSDNGKIPSNAAAIISDSNKKRVEALHERNTIDQKRVQNDALQTDVAKERLEFDKMLHLEQVQLTKLTSIIKRKEILLKENEQNAYVDLRRDNIAFKVKKLELKDKERADKFEIQKLELQKSERMEALKLEYEFKLNLEVAKMKNNVTA